MPVFDTVLWDWNGTLLDDAALCCELLNTMLARHGYAPVGSMRCVYETDRRQRLHGRRRPPVGRTRYHPRACGVTQPLLNNEENRRPARH